MLSFLIEFYVAVLQAVLPVGAPGVSTATVLPPVATMPTRQGTGSARALVSVMEMLWKECCVPTSPVVSSDHLKTH